jgi:hypothetical protein
MSTNPPGWYDYGPGTRRWWDGAKWTEHVQSTEGGSDAAPGSESDGADPGVAAVPVGAPATLSAGDAAQAPPSAPGFPGGPGNVPAGGAFAAATAPKKSRMWILWLVLGILLLGFVIAAAVIVPIVIASVSGSAQEQAAVRAVELYDEAWREGDCDKYFTATTEAFREGNGITDCETFEGASANFSSSVENYEVNVGDIDRRDGAITVDTVETYDSLLDQEGQELDTPLPIEEEWVYTIVEVDGEWVIDNALVN